MKSRLFALIVTAVALISIGCSSSSSSDSTASIASLYLGSEGYTLDSRKSHDLGLSGTISGDFDCSASESCNAIYAGSSYTVTNTDNTETTYYYAGFGVIDATSVADTELKLTIGISRTESEYEYDDTDENDDKDHGFPNPSIASTLFASSVKAVVKNTANNTATLYSVVVGNPTLNVEVIESEKAYKLTFTSDLTLQNKDNTSDTITIAQDSTIIGYRN
jgi:hypothetical protein